MSWRIEKQHWSCMSKKIVLPPVALLQVSTVICFGEVLSGKEKKGTERKPASNILLPS
jgi:hypothetical protein